MCLMPDAEGTPVLDDTEWCHGIWDTKRLILPPALINVSPVHRWASSACATTIPQGAHLHLLLFATYFLHSYVVL